MKTKKINLSLSKLIEFLEKHGYLFVKLYRVNKEIKFVECKTPKYQKTFILNIPSRYKMISSKKEDIRVKHEILDPSPEFIDFTINMKGENIDLDLFIVSYGFVYLYSEGDGIKSFSIENDKTFKEEKIDEIKKLEMEVVETLKKSSPDIKFPKLKKKQNEEDIILEGDEESGLIFEDDGELIDEVKLSMENDLEIETEEKEEDDFIINNELPRKIEDKNIIFGMVYISVNLREFFKETKEWENVITYSYSQLEENEVEMRVKILKEINELVMESTRKTKTNLDLIERKEKKLKFQLEKLTMLLTKSESLLSSIGISPKSKGIDKKEMEDLCNRTRETIKELNVKLLLLRDEANELLINYREKAKELLLV